MITSPISIMRIQSVFILIARLTVVSPITSEKPTSECPCGVGGLCLINTNSYMHDPECEKNEIVSKGLYTADNELVDRCESNPCQHNGNCVRTFGSFYCQCTDPYYGQNCELIRKTNYQASFVGVASHVQVYYQVQPGSFGTHEFTVILESDSIDRDIETFNVEIKFEIKVSDHRQFFPLVGAQFRKRNVYEECLKETSTFPDLMDPRVCELLPRRAVWSFIVESTLEDRLLDKEGLVYTNSEEDPVARAGNVIVKVYWEPTPLVKTLIFSETYIVVTYYYESRNPCLIEFNFHGCNYDGAYPTLHRRGTDILIKPVKIMVSCKGIVPITAEWDIQKLNDNKDPVPVRVDESQYRNDDQLLIPATTLGFGQYMLQFTYKVRGNPPHASGDLLLAQKGYCWFDIISSPVIVHAVGGDRRSYPCDTTAELKIVNYNPDLIEHELRYKVSCNRSYIEDPECQPAALEVPAIIKLGTPCNEIYEFTLEVSTNELFDLKPEVVKLELHFIETEKDLDIECVFNCNPNDPSEKTIWIASTFPYYVTSAVSWKLSLSSDSNFAITREVVHSFHPASASRIWRSKKKEIPMDSAISNINFRATFETLFSESSEIVDNIGYHVRQFTLSKNGSVYQYSVPSGPIEFSYPPIKYQVFQVHQETLGSILLMETNYQDRIFVSSEWNHVALCAIDSYRIGDCTSLSEIEPHSKDWSIETLEQTLRMGKERTFMNGLAIFLNKDLYKNGDGKTADTPLRWSISVHSRIKLMLLLDQLSIEYFSQPDFVTVLYILTLMSFSTVGNEENHMPHFKDEEIDKPVGVFEWLELRDTLMLQVQRTAEVLRTLSSSQYKEIQRIPLKNIFDRFILLTSLADYQYNIVMKFFPLIKLKYGSAEILFRYWRSFLRIRDGCNVLVGALVNFATMYYGVRSYGNRHMRTWFVKDTYEGIRYVLSQRVADETEEFFRPDFDDEKWMKPFAIELPHGDSSYAYKQYSFAATLLKIAGHSVEASPSAFLWLIDKYGKPVRNLPDQTTFYKVTMPRKPPNDAHMFAGTVDIFRDQRNNERLYTLYKITLPTSVTSWFMKIYLMEDTPLKAIVSSSEAPSYEDVLNSEPLAVSFVPETRLYKCEVQVLADDSGYVPTSFYLGMLPTSKLMARRKISFLVKNALDICYSLDFVSDTIEEICKGFAQNVGDVIVCKCKTFGLIFAARRNIDFVKLLTDQISFEITETFYFGYIILLSVIFLIVIVVIIFAFMRDLAHSSVGFVKMEDTYPYEEFPLLIGVFTGLVPHAGTKSTVAIRVIGENDRSKVHLLRTSKKTKLAAASDNWFVMTTRIHLGTITEVILWHNFRNLSNWYCSHLLIYDPTSSRWYNVRVERWFRLYEPLDEARSATFPAEETLFETGVEENVFYPHYVRELQNTHHTLSVYTMNPRSLYSYEQRALIFAVKFLLICCFTWITLEYLFAFFFIEHPPDQVSNLFELEREAFILALMISVFSSITIIPLEMACKARHLSTALQRKTTNPQFFELKTDAKHDPMFQKSRTQSRARQSDARNDSWARKSRTQSRARQSEARMESWARKSRTQSRAIRPDNRRQTGVTGQKAIYFFDASEVNRNSGRRVLYTWMKIWTIFFIPSQYLQVNANRELLSYKLGLAHLRIRIITAAVIIGLSALFVCATVCTNFYTKSVVTAYMIFLALAVDLLIVNPLIILLISLIAVFILHMSNKEWLLVGEDSRIPLPTPIPYGKYLTVATGKVYKPLLISDLEVLRRKELKKNLIYEGIFYFLSALFVILCCIFLYAQDIRTIYYSVHAVHETTTSSYYTKYLDILGPSANDVHQWTSAIEFVIFNFAFSENRWPNNKYIDESQAYWTRDVVSKPLDSMNIIIGLMNVHDNLRLSKSFQPYYARAYGYLSDSSYSTEPLIMNGQFLNFSKSSISNQIQGKSGEFYSFSGHNCPLQYGESKTYYIIMRTIFDELFNRTKTLRVIRVIIVSSNYVNAFAGILYTAHVVLESLPSNLCTAAVRINAITLRRTYLSKIVRLIMIPISAIIIVLIVIWLSKTECKSAAGKCHVGVKILTALAIALTTVSLLHSYYPNLDEVEKFAYSSPSDYDDLGAVYKRSMSDMVVICFAVFLQLVDASMFVRKIFGEEELEFAFYNSIQQIGRVFCFSLLVIIPMLIHPGNRDTGLSLQPYSLAVFIIDPWFKEFNEIKKFTQFKQIAFGITVALAIVLTKLMTSVSIAEYLSSAGLSQKLYTSRMSTKFIMIGNDWPRQKDSASMMDDDDEMDRDDSLSASPQPPQPPSTLTSGLQEKFKMLWGMSK